MLSPCTDRIQRRHRYLSSRHGATHAAPGQLSGQKQHRARTKQSHSLRCNPISVNKYTQRLPSEVSPQARIDEIQ